MDAASENVFNVTGNVNGTWSNYTRGLYGDPSQKAGKHPLITLTVPAIMFTCGVLGNLLAIAVLLKSSKEHKQTVFYRLVGALAVTDLFGICATSPLTLLVYSNNLKWVGGESSCNYESFMMIFAGDATLFIVGSMAIDRFIAIKYPFFYDKNITFTKAKFVIVGLWLSAAFIGCLPLMGLGQNVVQFPGTWCFFSFTSKPFKNQIFAYGYASIGLFVIGLTAISNIFVTGVLLKMRRKAIRTMGSSIKKRHDSELQMMVLLLGIIVIFSTCWCPFMIRIIVNQSNFRQVNRTADLMALRLASINQILDPWIYILFRKEMFARVIRFFKVHVFRRCRCLGHGMLTLGGIRAPKDNQLEKAIDDDENMALECPVNCSPSKGEADNWEKVTLRETPGRMSVRKPLSCNLHLKHSSCLFCFSQHPRSLVLSAISETNSKSAETLDQFHQRGAHGHCDGHECPSFIQTGCRRESIHLSLTDLRRDEFDSDTFQNPNITAALKENDRVTNF